MITFRFPRVAAPRRSREEHPGDAARRFVAFGADPEQVFLLDRLEKPFPDLRAAVETTDAGLVVIDTLAAFAATMVDDPQNSAVWTPVMARLTAIARDTDAAILLLHHARKSDGSYRDSTAIGADVDAVLELHPGADASERKLKGKARWAIEDCTVRLEGERYTLATGELSIDARVLFFVENNLGCSMRQLREGVQGKAALIDAAAHRLLECGALEDRGTDTVGRSLFVTNQDRAWDTGRVSHENRGDTRRNTVAGHGGEGGVSLFQTIGKRNGTRCQRHSSRTSLPHPLTTRRKGRDSSGVDALTLLAALQRCGSRDATWARPLDAGVGAGGGSLESTL